MHVNSQPPMQFLRTEYCCRPAMEPETSFLSFYASAGHRQAEALCFRVIRP